MPNGNGNHAKVTNDDVVAYVISKDKSTRDTLALLKKQMKHFDLERTRMDREFDERQAMHIQFIENDKLHHAERIDLHEKKKEGLALIIMKLEGEIAEDLDVGSDGVVITLPSLPAPEIRRPQKQLKPTLAERLHIKKARA